jgi:hypothetical protein
MVSVVSKFRTTAWRKKISALKIFFLFGVGFGPGFVIRLGVLAGCSLVFFLGTFLAKFLQVLSRKGYSIRYNKISILIFSALAGLILGLAADNFNLGLLYIGFLSSLLLTAQLIDYVYASRRDIIMSYRRLVAEIRENLF